MTIREQYIRLFPQDERGEIERLTRQLTSDDNSSQLWALLMVKQSETNLPEVLKSAVVGNLEAVKQLNSLMSMRSFWVKIAAIFVISTTTIIGGGLGAEYIYFQHLSHDLSARVLNEQSAALKEIREEAKGIAQAQRAIAKDQQVLLNNQKSIYETQQSLAKQVAGSAAEVQKTIEQAKAGINDEKESAITKINEANKHANTLLCIAEALKIPGAALTKYDGRTGLYMNRANAELIPASSTDDDHVLFLLTPNQPAAHK